MSVFEFFRGRLIFFIFLFLSFSVKAQYNFLANKTYAERYYLMDSLFFNDKLKHEDSIPVFNELNKLVLLATDKKDRELQLEAEFMHADYYLVGKQRNYSQFEKDIIELIKTADNEQIPQLRIRSRVVLASYYFNLQKYGPAFENYLQAYELLKTIEAKDFPNKQEIIDGIGAAYYNIGDYGTAHNFLLEARQYPNSYKKNAAINAINTLGLILRSQKKYDSAIFYFQRAYQIAKNKKDTTWMGITSGNTGIVYFFQGRYDDAIPLLETDVKESIKAGENDNGVNSLMRLIEIRLIKNDIATAESEIAYAKQEIANTIDKDKHQQKLFFLISRLNALKGNMDLAYRYLDSARILRDTITNRTNTLALAREEKKIEVQKYIAQGKLLKSEKRLYSIMRNGLIGGLFLLALIAILIISRQRIKYQHERNELYFEKKIAQAQLELAKNHLQDFMRNVKEKNELMDHFAEQLDKLQSIGYNLEDNEMLNRLQQTTILSDEQWEEFRRMFDTVHKGYLNRLGEKLPGLSSAEIKFVALSKLKLSGKEMATVLGVGTDTIRQYRHRLRKKLNLSEEQDLHELVENI